MSILKICKIVRENQTLNFLVQQFLIFFLANCATSTLNLYNCHPKSSAKTLCIHINVGKWADFSGPITVLNEMRPAWPKFCVLSIKRSLKNLKK